MKLTNGRITFYKLFGKYYFCLSTYAGMGFGMNEDYTYFKRVLPFIYKNDAWWN